jgi:hypothetical protein
MMTASSNVSQGQDAHGRAAQGAIGLRKLTWCVMLNIDATKYNEIDSYFLMRLP